MTITPYWLNLAVALGIGLIIGTERERSKSTDENRAVAGVRTFAIAALLGATSYMMHLWVHIAILVGVMGFVSVAYVTNQNQDPGLTTEISLLFTIILGGLSITDMTLAASLGVLTAFLLLIKKRLHGFVLRKVTETELQEILILAAATLIILPIVPNRFIGPFDAINPRNLWLIVIMVMAINALGHLALRVFGQRLGLPISGFVSGFISSIATIGALADKSKKTPDLVLSAATGATFSSLATVMELSLIITAVHPPTMNLIKWPMLMAGFSIGIYGLFLASKSMHLPQRHHQLPKEAFSIKHSLYFAGLIAVVSIIAAALNVWFGQSGLIVASGVAGLADSHAPSISVATMAASGKMNAMQAVIPILVAFSMNTLSKGFIAIMNGNKAFADIVITGLVLQIIAVWIGWWLI